MNGPSERRQHAQVPDHWLSVDLSLTAWRVGIAILLRYDPSRPGSSYPGVPWIARKTRLTERNVFRGLAELRRHSLLRVEGPRGSRKTNAYTVVLTSPPDMSESDRGSPNSVDGTLSDSDTPDLSEIDRGTLSDSDRESYQLSSPIPDQLPEPAVQDDDAVASSSPPPIKPTDDHDEDTATPPFPSLVVDDGKHAKPRKTTATKKTTDEAWVAGIHERVKALYDQRFPDLEYAQLIDVGMRHAIRFMAKGTKGRKEVRSAGRIIAAKLNNLAIKPDRDRPWLRELTIQGYFAFAGEVWRAGEKTDWDRPWDIVACAESKEPGTAADAGPPAQTSPKLFLDIKREELGVEGFAAWSAERTRKIEAQRRLDDEQQADTARLLAEIEALGDVEEESEDDDVLPGAPEWVREIARHERTLAKAPLWTFVRERGNRKRLAELHAILFDPGDYDADDEAATRNIGDRYTAELEPLCIELGTIDRGFTVADYCAVAVELLDAGNKKSTVSLAEVSEAILARARGFQAVASAQVSA